MIKIKQANTFLILFAAICLLPATIPAKENHSAPSGENRLHMVYMPPGYKLKAAERIRLNNKKIFIDLYARSFSQGNAVYAEIYSSSNDNKKLKINSFLFGKRKVLLSKKGWGYRGFFPLAPYEKTGLRKIAVDYHFNGVHGTFLNRIKIKKTYFPVYKRPLDLGKFSDTRKRTPEEIVFIKESAVKKKAAFLHRGKDLITGTFSHPRDMHFITSPFWSKRVYMRYRKRKGKKIRMKNTSSTHRGLDLRGEKGTPVYSLADGEVVLSDKLYYEGNMVIIDHGNGIFSYFMHMNDRIVKKSDIVRAGSVIGHVGSSGSSTAAHLHVSLYIRGIHIDPLSLLPLPVRD